MTRTFLYKFSTPKKGSRFQDGIDKETAFYETVIADESNIESFLKQGYAPSYQEARDFKKAVKPPKETA